MGRVIQSALFSFTCSSLLLVACRTVASTFYVTDPSDTLNSTSLRGAVIAANRAGGKNTIVLGQGLRRAGQTNWVYTLSQSGQHEDLARSGDLDVTSGQLTIVGAQPGVTIDATAMGDRVFEVFVNAQLTLKNLTIVGGSAPDGVRSQSGGVDDVITLPLAKSVKSAGTRSSYEGSPGGAVCNAGAVLLDNCVIRNNRAGDGGDEKDGAGGGGIYNTGTLIAKDCVFRENASGDGFSGASGGPGGAIMNNGFCTLTDCVIGENTSGRGRNGGDGGGVYNSGKATLTRCLVGANRSGVGGTAGWNYWYYVLGGNGGNGAGIDNAGDMQINSSTVYANVAGAGGNLLGGNISQAGSGGFGGGVYNQGNLVMNSSTVSANTAGSGGSGKNEAGLLLGYGAGGHGGDGGGLYNAGQLQVTSSTFTANKTGPGGDGSHLFGSNGDQDAPRGGDGGHGGGIQNDADSRNVVIRNSLVASNFASAGGAGGVLTVSYLVNSNWVVEEKTGDPGQDGVGVDLAGVFTTAGFNLVGISDASAGFTNGLRADRVGTLAVPLNPLLGPLQMNGGQTPTHALLGGSPAIDQGNSFRISLDQRGRHRPYKFPSTAKPPGGDGADIGAFELQR